MKTTLILATGLLTAIGSQAETLQSAKVTTKVNDVRIYQPSKSGRQAALGDGISGHTSVQTGRRSRAELTFQDKTITRLGANSTFSFRRGSRDISLNSGTILLQVPKSAGGATIHTATVTAAISGTTLMMEYNLGKWVKLITLEGDVHLKIKGKKSDGRNGGEPFRKSKKVKVSAGKMIIMRPDGEIITKPVDVDIKRLLKTSILAGNKIFAPLPPEALRQIENTLSSQDELKREGVLVSENVIERQPGAEIIEQGKTTTDIINGDPKMETPPRRRWFTPPGGGDEGSGNVEGPPLD